LSNAGNQIAQADPAMLTAAIAALREGQLVVYPTETFYGLAADPFSDIAMRRLFELKGRDAGKAVALIASDIESAFAIAAEVSAGARRLAEVFWPGPLTLVLPSRTGLNEALIGPGGGIGVRVSSHPTARALAAGLGRPITATSANISGEPPASTLSAARDVLGDKVRIYIDGGTLTGGAPSTVVAVDSNVPRLIRAGAIAEEAIASALATGGGR
jgi:L-threonylcarbamoyladenylate synthase